MHSSLTDMPNFVIFSKIVLISLTDVHLYIQNVQNQVPYTTNHSSTYQR